MTTVAKTKDLLDSVAELPLEKLQAEAQGLRDKLNRFRLGLGRHFVDKQPLIDLMLVAAVAQEPLLLIAHFAGPQITALDCSPKSILGPPATDEVPINSTTLFDVLSAIADELGRPSNCIG